MNDAPNGPKTNVIPVWGLTPDECTRILVHVDIFIAQGRVSKVKEKRLRTYICIYDQQGAPYTVTREQRILQLLDPSGSLIMIGKNVDMLMDMLDGCLPDQCLTVDDVV